MWMFHCALLSGNGKYVCAIDDIVKRIVIRNNNFFITVGITGTGGN
jgi:hypothetical protein